MANQERSSAVKSQKGLAFPRLDRNKTHVPSNGAASSRSAGSTRARRAATGGGPPRPAGLDRQGGGRLDGPLGGREPAVQEHEFRALSTYDEVPGATLLDWPVSLAEMEPWYAMAEDRMGVTNTNGIAPLPGNNNFKVLKAGADKLGYAKCHTGNMAINSAERDGRMACQQTGFCFQGCKWDAKWLTLNAEIPKGEATGKLEVRPNAQALRIEHDAGGRGHGRRLRRQGRRGAAAGGADRRGRGQLDREPAAAAQLGVEHVP